MDVLPASVPMHHMHAVPKETRREQQIPLELELQMVQTPPTFPPVFLQVFPDENGTPDLRKSSQPMLLSPPTGKSLITSLQFSFLRNSDCLGVCIIPFRIHVCLLCSVSAAGL